MPETGNTATLERPRYPNGQHPNSRANLLPDFKPGTRNVGRKPSLKTKIRRFLQEEVDTYVFDGQPITREDRLILKAIDDAESCFEPIDRHRALNIILDRLYGKAVQNQNTKVSGQVQHSHIIGKPIATLSKEELIAAKNDPSIDIQDGYLVQIAEFIDRDEVFQSAPQD